MIEAIVARHAESALAPTCALLRGAVAGHFAADPAQLAAAANELVASLPGDPALAPVDDWGRKRHVTPGAGVIVDLVTIVETVDARLAQRLARHLLAWLRHTASTMPWSRPSSAFWMVERGHLGRP